MQTVYYGEFNVELWEFALLAGYLFIIWFISSWIKNARIEKHPEYKFYMWGLLAKLSGGIALGLVYVYYYKDGDTAYYYQSALAHVNLFFKHPKNALYVLFSSQEKEYLYYFDSTTGYPLWFIYRNIKTYTVVRIITPLMLASAKSYMICTALVAWISYFGIWNVFRLFCKYYKGMQWPLAIAFLFIPSVVFWGSGILKDTFTYSAACWFVYGVHNLFISRSRIFYNILYVLVASYLIICIKPYIFVALLPGCLVWVLFKNLTKLRNRLVVILLIPILIGGSMGGSLGLVMGMGGILGEYSIDNVVNKAVITQQDMQKEYYGGKTFDIGRYDATYLGMLQKAPVALVSGLYRPFIWEAANPLMAVSGVEGLLLLLLTAWAIIRARVYKLFVFAYKDPLLLFCLTFALFFATSLGLTVPNFGALVRFKIPFLPFILAALFIIEYHVRALKKEKIEKMLRSARSSPIMEPGRVQSP